jgi:hypothetical protein
MAAYVPGAAYSRAAIPKTLHSSVFPLRLVDLRVLSMSYRHHEATNRPCAGHQLPGATPPVAHRIDWLVLVRFVMGPKYSQRILVSDSWQSVLTNLNVTCRFRLRSMQWSEARTAHTSVRSLELTIGRAAVLTTDRP